MHLMTAHFAATNREFDDYKNRNDSTGSGQSFASPDCAGYCPIKGNFRGFRNGIGRVLVDNRIKRPL